MVSVCSYVCDFALSVTFIVQASRSTLTTCPSRRETRLGSWDHATRYTGTWLRTAMAEGVLSPSTTSGWWMAQLMSLQLLPRPLRTGLLLPCPLRTGLLLPCPLWTGLLLPGLLPRSLRTGLLLPRPLQTGLLLPHPLQASLLLLQPLPLPAVKVTTVTESVPLSLPQNSDLRMRRRLPPPASTLTC